MRFAAVVVVAAAAACGRIGFDNRGDGTMDNSADSGLAGLVVRYPMDDDPSMGVVNSSLASANGTCTACPFSTIGHDTSGGYAFDGTQFIALPQSIAAFVGSAPHTVTAWVRPQPAGGTVLAKPLSAADTTNPFKLAITAGNITYETATSETNADFDSVAITLAGAWHHVAATWDGTNKRLYIDGINMGTEPTIPIDATYPMWIGTDFDANVAMNQYAGDLDELEIYSRALEDSEIAALATM